MHRQAYRWLWAAAAPLALLLALSPAAMGQHSQHRSPGIRSHHGLGHRSQHSSSRHAIPHHYLAHRDDRHDYSSVRRHHGLGNDGYYDPHSVRRFHGLGDGHAGSYYYDPHSVRRYRGLGDGYAGSQYYYYSSSYYPENYDDDGPSSGANYRGSYNDAERVAPEYPAQRGSSPLKIVVVYPPDETGQRRNKLVFPNAEYAWSKLSDGEADAALRAFSTISKSSPDDTLAKVGYALAAVFLEDDSTAIWAMRRAFRMDASAVHYAPIDAALQDQIHRLIGRYAYELQPVEDRRDAAFMTAALHFILHEHAEATAAAESAIDQGDTDDSTRYLLDTLHELSAQTDPAQTVALPIPDETDQRDLK